MLAYHSLDIQLQVNIVLSCENVHHSFLNLAVWKNAEKITDHNYIVAVTTYSIEVEMSMTLFLQKYMYHFVTDLKKSFVFSGENGRRC